MDQFFWVLNFSILEALSNVYMSLACWFGHSHPSTAPRSLCHSFGQLWAGDGFLTASECWYYGSAGAGREPGRPWTAAFIPVCPWAQVYLWTASLQIQSKKKQKKSRAHLLDHCLWQASLTVYNIRHILAPSLFPDLPALMNSCLHTCTLSLLGPRWQGCEKSRGSLCLSRTSPQNSGLLPGDLLLP